MSHDAQANDQMDDQMNDHERTYANIVDILIKGQYHVNSQIHFYQADIRNPDDLHNVFGKYNFDLVLHFAALKSVGESQTYPELYYQTNVQGTKNLLHVMHLAGCKKLIYSSSATVYGSQKSPVTETSETGVGLGRNYAWNKYDTEQYLIQNKEQLFDDWDTHKHQTGI